MVDHLGPLPVSGTVGERSRGTVSAELLLARPLVFQGRVPEARALSHAIRDRQADARSVGLTECDFGPGESLMHQMVDLACSGNSPQAGSHRDVDAAWKALLDESAKITQQPQDTVEILEIWGLTALRSGRAAEAEQRLPQAVELSERSADVVAARVRASLALAEARTRGS